VEPVGYGSTSGAIKELAKIGAVEGVHYRLSAEGEDITDFILAIDIGPMIVTMEKGLEVMKTPDFSTFAILNPAGMELVGGSVTAASMRAGKIPAEAAYVLSVDDE
jgi:hypothetical protein